MVNNILKNIKNWIIEVILLYIVNSTLTLIIKKPTGGRPVKIKNKK